MAGKRGSIPTSGLPSDQHVNSLLCTLCRTPNSGYISFCDIAYELCIFTLYCPISLYTHAFVQPANIYRGPAWARGTFQNTQVTRKTETHGRVQSHFKAAETQHE